MVSEAPPFWWRPDAGMPALLLAPVSAAYAAIARRRLLTARREKVDAPVLCVGNLTVGGSGKTPVAIALAGAARAMGRHPGFLTRGHGGSIAGPHMVDAAHDGARHVGDEPLLLARAAPTAIAVDRAAGAARLIAEGCDFLIMDDGFQSARIHMDYALIVVDARRGVGNGRVVPAGPLRARVPDQIPYVDAMLSVGEGSAAAGVVRAAARAGRPVHIARLRAFPPEGLAGRHCLAFAGIGDPGKFFDTVEAAGGEIGLARRFPDHHDYREDDAQDLLASAAARELTLVTTAKDAVRLAHGGPKMRELHEKALVIEVEIEFELEGTAPAIVAHTLEAWRRRRIGND